MSVGFRTKVCLLLVLVSSASVYLASCAGKPGAAKATPNSPESAPTVPAMPGNLTALAGNAQVTLAWSGSNGATSYRVKRALTGGGPYAQLATTSNIGYVDTPVTNGTTYFYTVSAVGSAGESADSTQVSARPLEPTSSPTPTVTSIVISPAVASLTISGTVSFTAVVQGTVSDKTVTWKALLGGINSAGIYTAPATAGTDTVTATSVADSGKFASATITITTPSAPPAPAPPTPPSSGLPQSFFSMSLREINAFHFPSVPFGGIRLWDTNTTWAQIEYSRGNYDWRALDTWTEGAINNGKDVMYTFGRVPHWASASTNLPPSDIASGNNQWKEFVTALVQHSQASPRHYISYYELWNEPDLKSNWAGTPAQLVTMARDAYAIIHALDPNAKFIGPTPSTANQFGVHFLPAYYAAGGATPQDIVGMHAYLYTGSDFSTSPANITLTISQVKALMAQYGISNKAIWLTEGNWNADGTDTLSQTEQAAYLAQEYVLIWSTDAVARYYWYQWDHLRVGTLWDDWNGIRLPGKAYGSLAHWLIGSTHSPNPCSTSADGTWTCALKLANGYPAAIVWNPSTSKTITVDASFATYETLFDTSLHSIAAHQIAIGPLPMLVIKSQTE
jgi:polysaccharide biosynthesis protein PslG